MLELCRAHGIALEECDLTLAQVYRADEMFCTGTMGELAAVTRVDGRRSATASPARSRRCEHWFRELTAREGTVVAEVSAAD